MDWQIVIFFIPSSMCLETLGGNGGSLGITANKKHNYNESIKQPIKACNELVQLL